MSEIRDASLADLPLVARCHRAAFPKALSSAMGLRYLTKMLEWYVVSDRAFMFMLIEEGKCIGYCGGLKYDETYSMGSASSMLQYSFRAAVWSFIQRPWLFVHPEFLAKYKLAGKNLWRRVSNFIKPAETIKVNHVVRVDERHTGLIVIGVDQQYHRRGYGTELLQAFEKKTASIGFRKMLLTVNSKNLQAIGAYGRNGWVITHSVGKSTTMEKHL